MAIKIENKLNIWEYTEYSRWYRIDQKIGLFFRKIKWMWQRAKYGWCDKDLWCLDYTIGNYLATSIEELANRSCGYPANVTPEEWDSILRNIARDFYLGVNEECWVNPYEELLSYEKTYNNLPKEDQATWDKWFEKEADNDRSKSIRIHEGFCKLEKWFKDLWD